MSIDFSSTAGLPEDGEGRNARLPAAAPILEPGAPTDLELMNGIQAEDPDALSQLILEPGAPTDLELMNGIQAEDPDALSQLYDRYNGIIKALILRVIHNE